MNNKTKELLNKSYIDISAIEINGNNGWRCYSVGNIPGYRPGTSYAAVKEPQKVKAILWITNVYKPNIYRVFFEDDTALDIYEDSSNLIIHYETETYLDGDEDE